MKKARPERFEIPMDKLCVGCAPSLFTFESTADLAHDLDIIGQDRATSALAFGLDMPSEGFNIYALGPSGVGKSTAVRKLIAEKAVDELVPAEWCYVHNFQEPRKPRALSFPASRCCQFRDDMDQLIKQAETEIPRAFESDYFRQRQGELMRGLQEKQAEELRQLEQYVQARGFRLLKTQMGLIIAPVLDGEVLNPEQYEQLPQEIKQRFEEHRHELQTALEDATRRARDTEKASREAMQQLSTEVANFALGHLVDELKQSYSDLSHVIDYVDAVQQDLVANVEWFLPHETPPQAPLGLGGPGDESLWLNRYKVNVIVDHCETKGAPIVIESNPTYYNLVGSIEHRAVMGAWLTDLTMIKSGALHQANGGYLVLDARSLLTQPLSWEALKRGLRTRSLKIEEMGQEYRPVTTATLEPEAIPLDLKVIILGGPEIYYPLQSIDEDFAKLFKVKADFEMQIPRSPENTLKYASFVSCRCQEEGLLHFAADGVGQVVEYSSRLTGDQTKLSTRFSEIADLVREASYWARRADHELVTVQDVQRAITERVYRSNRIEERMTEMIQDGTIMIDVEGQVIGQVNGLAVISLGDYVFGRPSRITAKSYLGHSGVVNIDREVKMTESIHDKGLLILSSFLRHRYGQERPLSLSASLVFEQGYEGVAGDSASSTELYALLSSIGQIPLRQDIAVTGSVNQHGQIQPVGGVTQKVEGFYDVCKAKGLTGNQGAIIPASNVRNLVLRPDVMEAIRSSAFHLYAVETIDQGISLLTGVEAGELGEDGAYPEGTVNRAVWDRLADMADKMAKYGKGSDAEGKEGSQGDDEDAATAAPDVSG